MKPNVFAKRYIRFSVGTLLVAMTGTALLLNQEVQRAKAIEATVNRIEQWQGSSTLRPRENFPSSFAKFLPRYWSEEIDSVFLAVYSDENPPTYYVRRYALIDPAEFDAMLSMGAIDNLSEAFLWGTAINRDAVSRICKSTSIEHAQFADVLVTDDDINELTQCFPQCSLNITPHDGTDK